VQFPFLVSPGQPRPGRTRGISGGWFSLPRSAVLLFARSVSFRFPLLLVDHLAAVLNKLLEEFLALTGIEFIDTGSFTDPVEIFSHVSKIPT
jgi:hypothetical protein